MSRRRRVVAVVLAGVTLAGVAGCSSYYRDSGNEPNQVHHTGPPLPSGVTISPFPTFQPSNSPPIQNPADGGS